MPVSVGQQTPPFLLANRPRRSCWPTGFHDRVGQQFATRLLANRAPAGPRRNRRRRHRRAVGSAAAGSARPDGLLVGGNEIDPHWREPPPMTDHHPTEPATRPPSLDGDAADDLLVANAGPSQTVDLDDDPSCAPQPTPQNAATAPSRCADRPPCTGRPGTDADLVAFAWPAPRTRRRPPESTPSWSQQVRSYPKSTSRSCPPRPSRGRTRSPGRRRPRRRPRRWPGLPARRQRTRYWIVDLRDRTLLALVLVDGIYEVAAQLDDDDPVAELDTGSGVVTVSLPALLS